jgi:hypothetical protein
MKIKFKNNLFLLRLFLILGIILLVTPGYFIHILISENIYLENTNRNYTMLADNNNKDIQYLLNSLDDNIFQKEYSLLILFNKYGCDPCKEITIKQLQNITPHKNIFLLTAMKNSDLILNKYNNVVLKAGIVDRFPDSVLLILVNKNKDIILKLSDFDLKPHILKEYSNLLNIIFKKM